jgi:hypothetical protein
VVIGELRSAFLPLALHNRKRNVAPDATSTAIEKEIRCGSFIKGSSFEKP